MAALGARIWTFHALGEIMPQNGLYVDERTYSGTPFLQQGTGGLSRPPGMFLLFMLTRAADHVILFRLVMSLASLLPAAALYLAFRGNGWTAAALAAGMALSPFLLLYGLQLMPAVPAAVLVSFSLLAAVKKRLYLAGFLFGIAALLRSELLLVPLFLLLISTAEHRKNALRYSISAFSAVIPVIALNLASGAGPVMSSNGFENLWIGSTWNLVRTPPGTEFEQLVSTGGSMEQGERVFFGRAMAVIRSDPAGWIGRGAMKSMAFFRLPGPGRNIETGWIMARTRIMYLLPLTFIAMVLGMAGVRRKECRFWELLALSVVLSGVTSAFIFFPSARSRVAFLPAFWFLAAGSLSNGFRKWRLLPWSVLVIVSSVILKYPGMERPGLSYLLAADRSISCGDPESSMEYLDLAEQRGYHGSDLNNIRGACLALSGDPEAALGEFETALSISPMSPTLWRNYAVCLWSSCKYDESVDAAIRAVYLNPSLEEELRPILCHERN